MAMTDGPFVGDPRTGAFGRTHTKDAQQIVKVSSSDAAIGDHFGNSVSISGDHMIVGAPSDNSASGDEPGSASLFSRDLGGTVDGWGEVIKLEPPDAEHLDRYGWAVAISGDTAVVGSIWDDDNGFSSGSAYIYSRNQGGADAWGLVKKITPADGVAYARFGISLAISGNTLAVGAEDWDDPSDAVYIFERHHGGPENWGEVAKIVPSDATDDNKIFGLDIALDGDHLIVGATGHDELGEDAGAAYIFGRNAGGAGAWGEVARITSPDGDAGDLFGASVAIKGDRVLVGESLDDEDGLEYGAAHVFARNAGGADAWGHVAKLVPPVRQDFAWFGYSVAFAADLAAVGSRLEDVGAENTGAVHLFAMNNGGVESWGYLGMVVPDDADQYDEFGIDVSADGNTVAVGAHQSDATGAAYVFRMDDPMWRHTAKRTASDGAAWDLFGAVLDLSGETLVAVAERQASNGTYAGAAYIFERDLGGVDGWQEAVKLTPSDARAELLFGESASLDGGIAVIGSVPHYVEGAAYVFYRNRGGRNAWGEVEKITADDGVHGARFADTLALDGDTLVVGAYDDAEEFEGAGAAYIFERNAGGLDNWGQVAKLTAGPDAGVDFYFGWSVAVHGDVVVVGAVGDDDRGYLTGAAYVFSRNQGGADAWGRVARLVASNPYENSWYGESVAVYGDTIAVGAALGLTRGRTYVYRRNHGGEDAWQQVANFGSSLTTRASRFGKFLTLERDTLVVSDPTATVRGVIMGSVHVRSRNAGGLENWGEVALLTPDDGAEHDRYGYGIALSGVNIAAGAYGDDDLGNSSGSVYLYRLAGDESDLGVEMVSDPSAVLPGSTFTLTATVSNAGPEAAEAASVDVAFDPATVDSTAVAWTCAPGPGATEGTVCPASGGGSALETGVDVSLNSGESVVFEVTVPVLGSASGQAETTGTVRPPDFTVDPLGSNNEETVVVDLIEFDFGDAPDPGFATLLASDGARHVIDDGLYLGSAIDPETDGQPTAAADGDDSDGLDDEDGVVFTSRVVPGQTAGVEVTASAAGLLDAWMDFNRDGDWNDPGEQVFTSQALSAGANALEIQVPAGAALGASFSRFRLSSQGSLGATGLAADGEVEDHPVAIVEPLPPEIFADGFESGLTWNWTDAVGDVTGEIFSDGFESAGISRWTVAVW